ncbi:MAG TPA: hypothetical protein VF867_18870 [Arthrobacter sp.]
MTTHASAPVQDSAPTTISKTRKGSTSFASVAAAALVLGALAAGTTFGLRFYVYEPQEQKAAFIEISSSSSDQLRAKSLDELVDLDANVARFAARTPGMLSIGIDAGIRVDHVIASKQGRR